LIQQALHRVVLPIHNPGFSEFSYGFRGRSAYQAAQQARNSVASGRRFFMDIPGEVL
jgi:hypothetical protein